jgi:DNA-directed RNA polymerase subunit RPC12/RpoP
MPDWVKDEDKWNKAKKLADEQGHKDEYDYITGIYKQMGGEIKSKESAIKRAINKSVRVLVEKYSILTQEKQRELFKEQFGDDVDNRVIMECMAITFGKPTRNNVRYQVPDKAVAETLVNKPFLDTHNDDTVFNTFGHVIKQEIRQEGNKYKQYAWVDVDPEEKKFIHKARRKDIPGVSIQVLVDEAEEDHEGIINAHIQEYLELSSVLIPGDGDTSSVIKERFNKMKEQNEPRPNKVFGDSNEELDEKTCATKEAAPSDLPDDKTHLDFLGPDKQKLFNPQKGQEVELNIKGRDEIIPGLVEKPDTILNMDDDFKKLLKDIAKKYNSRKPENFVCLNCEEKLSYLPLTERYSYIKCLKCGYENVMAEDLTTNGGSDLIEDGMATKIKKAVEPEKDDYIEFFMSKEGGNHLKKSAIAIYEALNRKNELMEVKKMISKRKLMEGQGADEDTSSLYRKIQNTPNPDAPETPKSGERGNPSYNAVEEDEMKKEEGIGANRDSTNPKLNVPKPNEPVTPKGANKNVPSYNGLERDEMQKGKLPGAIQEQEYSVEDTEADIGMVMQKLAEIEQRLSVIEEGEKDEAPLEEQNLPMYNQMDDNKNEDDEEMEYTEKKRRLNNVNKVKTVSSIKIEKINDAFSEQKKPEESLVKKYLEHYKNANRI